MVACCACSCRDSAGLVHADTCKFPVQEMIIYLSLLILHGAANHASSEFIGWLAVATSVVALGGGMLDNATEPSPTLVTDHHHARQDTDRCLRIGI